MNHLNIRNIHKFDCESIFKFAVNYFPNNSHFVEIGVAEGKSSAYLGVEIINSGKQIKLDCIDAWLMKTDSSKNYTQTFRNNLKPIWDKLDISVIQNYSTEASKLYSDESLDFVFIDGDHSYEGLSADIINWLPKLKSNGIIAGHDYTNEYKTNVIKAVDEYFGKDNVNVDNSSWYVFMKDIKIEKYKKNNLL